MFFLSHLRTLPPPLHHSGPPRKWGLCKQTTILPTFKTPQCMMMSVDDRENGSRTLPMFNAISQVTKYQTESNTSYGVSPSSTIGSLRTWPTNKTLIELAE